MMLCRSSNENRLFGGIYGLQPQGKKARREDMPHDGRRREPLVTAPPQSCQSVTVELLLTGRRFIEHILINLPTEEYNVGSKNAVFWDIFTAITLKDVVLWDKTLCSPIKKNR
jgi:hypothetical protein